MKKASKWSVSLQVVINGGATSSGEQDNEDTELMAIYTTENGIAEKVLLESAPATHPPLLSQIPYKEADIHLEFCLYPPECVCVGSLYNGNRRSDEE